MYSSSPSPPSHDCSPRLVRPGGRACAHAWPAPRTLSPFLAAGVAAALRARLGPLGDPPPSERGGPQRPRSLLSAAGGRVATFVNCKQTHVVLQQSRPCLVLVAFPPLASSSPLLRRLPSSPSFIAVSGRPLQGGLRGPGRAWGRGADGYNAAKPRLQARGGGRGAGWCECLQGAAAAGSGGRAGVGVREWAGPEGPARPAGSAVDPGTLAATR